MIYLTVIPNTINVINAEPLFTKSGGFKIGDRYFYPPHWHLSLEEAKEYLSIQHQLAITCAEIKLAELKNSLNTPPIIVGGEPQLKGKGK